MGGDLKPNPGGNRNQLHKIASNHERNGWNNPTRAQQALRLSFKAHSRADPRKSGLTRCWPEKARLNCDHCLYDSDKLTCNTEVLILCSMQTQIMRRNSNGSATDLLDEPHPRNPQWHLMARKEICLKWRTRQDKKRSARTCPHVVSLFVIIRLCVVQFLRIPPSCEQQQQHTHTHTDTHMGCTDLLSISDFCGLSSSW